MNAGHIIVRSQPQQNVQYHHHHNNLYVSASLENQNDTSTKYISLFADNITHTDLTIIKSGVSNYYGCLYIYTLHCKIKCDTSISMII